MNNYWFNKLLDVLNIQTNGENEKLMVLYLDREIRKLKLPYTIDAAGNVIVVKGEAGTYPCVVSHMDTVHNFVSNFNIYQDKDDKDILFSQSGKRRVGIGGDDKCGVFACLYLLKTIPNIKVVFFSREESGCKGSRSIDKKFFDNCRYIIQLDRRGGRDFIQTYCGKKTISHEFSSEVGLIKKKYRYKNATGTVTDVMKLWDNKVGISCINLSCGYYEPHTVNEYISISELWNSIKFTEEIINSIQQKKYVSIPPPIVVKNIYNNAVSYNAHTPKYEQCDKCKAWRIVTFTIKGKKLCWSCREEHTKKKVEHNKLPNDNDSPSGDNNQNKEAIIFACYECGIKPAEMKNGDKLVYINTDGCKRLYCSGCAALFNGNNANDSPSDNDNPKNDIEECETCDLPIPKGQSKMMMHGMTMCNDCVAFFEDNSQPEKCWVCKKIIPKDHKIIKRYNRRICENCASPYDETQ